MIPNVFILGFGNNEAYIKEFKCNFEGGIFVFYNEYHMIDKLIKKHGKVNIVCFSVGSLYVLESERFMLYKKHINKIILIGVPYEKKTFIKTYLPFIFPCLPILLKRMIYRSFNPESPDCIVNEVISYKKHHFTSLSKLLFRNDLVHTIYNNKDIHFHLLCGIKDEYMWYSTALSSYLNNVFIHSVDSNHHILYNLSDYTSLKIQKILNIIK